VNPETGPDEQTHVQRLEQPQAGEPGLSDVVGSLLATPLGQDLDPTIVPTAGAVAPPKADTATVEAQRGGLWDQARNARRVLQTPSPRQDLPQQGVGLATVHEKSQRTVLRAVAVLVTRHVATAAPRQRKRRLSHKRARADPIPSRGGVGDRRPGCGGPRARCQTPIQAPGPKDPALDSAARGLTGTAVAPRTIPGDRRAPQNRPARTIAPPHSPDHTGGGLSVGGHERRPVASAPRAWMLKGRLGHGRRSASGRTSTLSLHHVYPIVAKKNLSGL
jgi:hypothetical protein